jgi:aspartyl-tRNA(Asn)/glutamyl-tRNA(Gln) amidotransferase subunit A
MRGDDLCYLELAEVAKLIQSNELSIEEVTIAVLDRIDALNPVLNCFITVLRDSAMASATALQAELRSGQRRGPLHGIPISLKDNILTKGIRTTAGSPILKYWIPDRDADVVTQLRSAGAIVVGKTNMQQYAYGAPHPEFGEVRNPHRLEMTCGGSSTGSAAATAAGLGYASVGTDTGGSIRIPAAYCGVVGLKPTYGLVSRTDVIPVSSNLDHVGPIARTVRDCTIMLAGLTTRHGEQPTERYTRDLERGVKGLRLGVVQRQERSPFDPSVSAAFKAACEDLGRQGATLIDVKLPDLFQAQVVMWTVSGVEAAELHRPQFRLHRDDYNAALATRLDSAQFVPATEYVHAQRVRQRFREEVDALFGMVDVVLLPTVGVPAFKAGTQRLAIGDREEDVANIGSRLTALFNLTGHPALAVPCHTSGDSLPISLQVVGAAGREALVMRVAYAYEGVHRWYRHRPAAAEVPNVTQ